MVLCGFGTCNVSAIFWEKFSYFVMKIFFTLLRKTRGLDFRGEL